MKSFLILLTLVGLSLSSTCSDTKPESNEDCLSVYMKKSMCCYHESRTGENVTRECIERPVTDSGYGHTQTMRGNSGEESDTVSCRIPIDICHLMFVDSAEECDVFSKNVKGGQCCMDVKQGICFSQPFHSQNKQYACVEHKKNLKD